MSAFYHVATTRWLSACQLKCPFIDSLQARYILMPRQKRSMSLLSFFCNCILTLEVIVSRKRLREVLWRQQRSRTGPNAIQPTRWDTQTHRAEGAERPWKQKNRAFFSTLGELPQLFSQPAQQRAACTGLSPQQHTPHPPDWPCHTKVRQNPPQLSTIRPGLHTATLTLTPDFPRLTITLGGWWGCFLQITQPRWLSGPQQHPQPPFFLTF